LFFGLFHFLHKCCCSKGLSILGFDLPILQKEVRTYDLEEIPSSELILYMVEGSGVLNKVQYQKAILLKPLIGVLSGL
jgi:hypothetical protein